MKKRILAILISVAIILLGVFGVNMVLAYQGNKQMNAKAQSKESGPQAQIKVDSSTQQTNSSQVSTDSSSKPESYDAISPAITPSSIDYMPSNKLSSQDNYSLSDISQNIIYGWASQINEDKNHQKDSLVNKGIKFRTYLGEFSYDYYKYPFVEGNNMSSTNSAEQALAIELVLPINTIGGKTVQEYTDTMRDMSSFSNYILNEYKPTGNYGIIITLRGKDGIALNYYTFRFKLGDFYYRNDFVYTNQGVASQYLSNIAENKLVYWSTPLQDQKSLGIKTMTPWDCPEAQQGLDQVGAKLAEGLKQIN